MTFEEVTKKYPLYTTYVGQFYCDERFTAHFYDDIKDIDRWEFSPFDWGSGWLPFVYYNEANDEFECWSFVYFVVSGYINETIHPNNFYPAIFSADYSNWEKIDVNNTDDIILVEPKNIDKDYEYLERIEQAAKVWDKEAFERGKIFCTADAIKNYFGDKQNG